MKVKWWARYFSSSCGLTQRVTCQSLNSLFFFSVLGNFVHLLRKPLTLPLAYSLRGQSVQLVDGLMPSLPLSLLIMSPPLLSIIFSPTYFSPRYSLSPLYFIHTLHSSPFSPLSFLSFCHSLSLPFLLSAVLPLSPLRDSPPSLPLSGVTWLICLSLSSVLHQTSLMADICSAVVLLSASQLLLYSLSVYLNPLHSYLCVCVCVHQGVYVYWFIQLFDNHSCCVYDHPSFLVMVQSLWRRHPEVFYV